MKKPVRKKGRNPLNMLPVFPELPYIILANFLVTGLLIDFLDGHPLWHSLRHGLQIIHVL